MDAPAAATRAIAAPPWRWRHWGRAVGTRHASRPDRPDWSDRDRFILSNGHCCILQYALAHEFGYDLSVDDLKAFRHPHSRTPAPERHCAPRSK